MKPKTCNLFENTDETHIFFFGIFKMIKQLTQIEQAKIKLSLIILCYKSKLKIPTFKNH